MCGICGAIQVGGEPGIPLEQATLDRMTDAMTHRGPDDRGTHLAPGAALGARRLSIVDVAGGHQPVSDERGAVAAVQNGEIYNHLDLRRLLASEGHRFRSRCDTDVLPHLYERYGPDFPKHLRGKFAIAVWDADRRRAVLARDRLGVKPLYWARAGELVLFASELKSLLASGLVATDLDYEAIDAYLALGFVPGPRTPLRRVSKLLPGTRLVVEDGELSISPYWRFPTGDAAPAAASVEECSARLLGELEDAVRARLMSDVPLGAMLSGGLDSSLVVALMARNMSEAVKTFSVGFVEAGRGNELADAREVASVLGADHHELELALPERSVELERLVWHLDEPLADLSSLGLFLLSELASDHVTVALSGQGADELLGGYSRHRNAALVDRLSRVPAPMRRAGAALGRRAGRRGARTAALLAAEDAASLYLAPRTVAYAARRQALATGPLAALDGHAPRRAVERCSQTAPDGALAGLLYLDANLGLVDDMLHYFDRASMAQSLEVRVPFLDHHVVEFCATLPASLKVHGLTTKYLLKRAARGLVPDRIVDKPKIGFFYHSVDLWMRAQVGGEAGELLLRGDARCHEFLDRRELERMVQEVRNGGGASHDLLAIVMLETWLSSFLPRAAALAQRGSVGTRVELST